MLNLIKDGNIVQDDPWQIFEASDAQAIPGHAVLPLSAWTDNGKELLESSLKFGALVSEDESIDALVPYLSKLEIIVFKFGKFADGRAFTYARTLRNQHKYAGEIRAFGDFIPDQVNYMQRCGFNSFATRTADEASIAIAIKDHFTTAYQSDAREKSPLYRRR